MPTSLKDLPTLKCEKCSNVTFRQSMIFKKLSALLSQTGKEELIPIDVLVCDKCGEISKVGLSNELIENLKSEGIIKENIIVS